MRTTPILRKLAILVAAATAVAAANLAGCSSVPRKPDTIRHVANADFHHQHPTCFQTKPVTPPKAFLVRNEQDWKSLWGQGEEPPVINFERAMVFVAFASISSEGPGSMEVWVLKYRETEDVLEVHVKEITSGTWPLSAGYSRAYEIVKLPQTDKPVKVLWRSIWGGRDETKESKAQEWTPPAPQGTTQPSGTQGRWQGQQYQNPQGGWQNTTQQAR